MSIDLNQEGNFLRGRETEWKLRYPSITEKGDRKLLTEKGDVIEKGDVTEKGDLVFH